MAICGPTTALIPFSFSPSSTSISINTYSNGGPQTSIFELSLAFNGSPGKKTIENPGCKSYPGGVTQICRCTHEQRF